jgi:hypothetical protein
MSALNTESVAQNTATAPTTLPTAAPHDNRASSPKFKLIGFGIVVLLLTVAGIVFLLQKKDGGVAAGGSAESDVCLVRGNPAEHFIVLKGPEKECKYKDVNVCLMYTMQPTLILVHANSGFMLHNDAGAVGIHKINLRTLSRSSRVPSFNPGSAEGSFKIVFKTSDGKVSAQLCAYRRNTDPYPPNKAPTPGDVNKDGLLLPFWLDTSDKGILKGTISPDDLVTEWTLKPAESGNAFFIAVSRFGLGKNLKEFEGKHLSPDFHGFLTRNDKENACSTCTQFYSKVHILQPGGVLENKPVAPENYALFTFK